MIQLDDTICAPATLGGTGAVGLIRLSGPRVMQIADAVVSFKNGNASSSKGYTIKYGEISGLDEVLVSVFRAPHSYTGEDSVEICCHASSFIMTRILERLVDAGARIAEPGEFTRRAFLNCKMDLTQAESVADLIASSDAASHRLAFKQMKGAYSSELKRLRDRLLEIAALLELELDFSEEDVEFADRKKFLSLLDEAQRQITTLLNSFRDGNAIRDGVPVAIVGEPNCGKSTLLNALIGDERAIVSDIPGTTRDTVEEYFILNGIKYRFIDTAGIRDTSDRIESIGIERSFGAVGKADIILYLIDPSSAAPFSVLDAVRSKLDEWQILFTVINKSDLFSTDFLAKLAENAGNKNVISISAKTGKGLQALTEAISASQKDRFNKDGVTVSNLRHYEALKRAGSNLTAVSNGINSGLYGELIAEELRSAIRELNTIFGDQIATDEILGEIFSRFCIGK